MVMRTRTHSTRRPATAPHRTRAQANILPAIFECARPDTCPPELNLEAAQLLLVLSEDSRAFAAQVGGNAMCVQVCGSNAAAGHSGAI